MYLNYRETTNRVEMDSGELFKKVLSQKDKMFRLALSILKDVDEAEDAVQDVFERLWVRREVLMSYRNMDAFILTAVRNECIDRIRSQKTRRDKSESIAHDINIRQSDAGKQIDLRDIKSIVQQLMSELPQRQREIMHLRDIEECEMGEIAQIVGIEEGAVRMNLSRARKTIRERLQKVMNHGIGQ